jgi:serine-type D-Ala-D-Ala carboxypeptidase (penicillin-binding protein 5/6)
VACQSVLAYTVIDMPKNLVKKVNNKHVHRTGGLLIALLFIAAVIFAFTRPILAPGSENDQADQNGNSIDSGTTFDDTNSDNINPEVGEGVKADSYLVYDESTGKILASRNPDTAVAIASITKLMTAYITQKYGNLTDEWAINGASTSDIRPILGLTIGDRVIVKDLVDAMLIGSANDAAAALGAYVSATAKTPIINLMNQEAKRLGMDSTHYENPIGFDSEQNYSTANNLKLLLDVVRPMPLFSEIDRKQAYSFVSISGKTYSVKATNTLVAEDPEIHAIKTGFTYEAKGAMITAVYHENRKFIMIVLGSTDREGDTKLLKTNILKQSP